MSPRGGAHRPQIPTRIDCESSAVAEIDEVTAVAEPLVDKWHDGRCDLDLLNVFKRRLE
jgi:hypothetical protein